MGIQPLWFYRWTDGTSLKIGAIVKDGKTLYGPVLPGNKKEKDES